MALCSRSINRTVSQFVSGSLCIKFFLWVEYNSFFYRPRSQAVPTHSAWKVLSEWSCKPLKVTCSPPPVRKIWSFCYQITPTHPHCFSCLITHAKFHLIHRPYLHTVLKCHTNVLLLFTAASVCVSCGAHVSVSCSLSQPGHSGWIVVILAEGCLLFRHRQV